MYVVYTAIFEGVWEYWYYGRYNTLGKALKAVAELDSNGSSDIYHNTCMAENAKRLGINNLPIDLR